MLKQNSSRALLLLAATLFATNMIAQTPKIRIMPLGDSITYGSGAPGGYRFPLYVALTNAGYNVDFVGTQTGNSVPGLGAEVNHQGHGGWRVSHPTTGLYENLNGWFEAIEDPHVVLIHAGTNDTNDPDFQHCINEMDAMITRIALCQPSAKIIVTTLMKRGSPTDSKYIAITNFFNPFVQPLVASHQSQGHNVYYLDMHAYVELADMGDALHPNAVGYQKMADAWFPAITNIIGTNVTANQPAPIQVNAVNNQSLTISFNKKLTLASATNTSNYAISGGITVTAAALSANQRTVTLTTSTQSSGVAYTLTMNNLADETLPAALTIAAGTQRTFVSITPRGAENHVSEFNDYTLIYSLDIPSAVGYNSVAVGYSVDRSALIPDGSFSRIAYYLELQKAGEGLQYLWVSMDAFAARAALIGVPAPITGAVYQQYVNKMNIFCNVPSVTTGSAIPGNIEFWPTNYSAPNAAGIPGASESIYDYGDKRDSGGTYGSMQIHNYGAAQTLLAFNNWGGSSGDVCLGIGNQPSSNPDWTFANNGAAYSVKTLQVYVKVDTRETTPPTAISAQAGAAGTLITVEFSEALAADSVKGSCFTVDHGVGVVSARLLRDKKRVAIITSAQPTATPLTLIINDIYDLSGNRIAANTSVNVAAYALPPEIAANAGVLADGYKLIYTLDIEPVGNLQNAGSEMYSYDQSALTGAFDRVAYYLELKRMTSTQYVWVSMDAFTAAKSGAGVPTFNSGLIYQQMVSNMDVKSNVGGVINGINLAGGNIEFWPNNYDKQNAAGVPGASETKFDFGDIRKTDGNYGSMQVHNYAASQTVFAYNHWNTGTVCLGIGNQPGGEPDWTFIENAARDYHSRKLHILVRPSATAAFSPPPPPQVAANIPSSSNYLHTCTIDLPVNGNFNTAPAQYYSVDNRAKLPPLFSRVAYYLETQSGTGPTQYVWTAMDKFTDDYNKLGVPVAGTIFQQYVTNLEVLSNVGGIITGSNITTGNIEFWPSNYNGTNDKGIPNASAKFDWGDGGANSGGGGHGSMQVHNYGAKQTLFAINHFNGGGQLAIGIGNSPTDDTDWTFLYNAGTYNHRRLYVFVLPDYNSHAPTPIPQVVRHVPSRDMNAVAVTFDRETTDSSAAIANFSLNNGVTITGAELLPNLKTIRLSTSPLTPGQSYTLTMGGVAARLVDATLMPSGTIYSFTVATPALPACLAAVPEIGDYEIAYQLAVGNQVNYATGCNYTFDESLFPPKGSFDRVAYCMELVNTNGVATWAYASMDAYSGDLRVVGVPTADRGATHQRRVNNMNVYASANAAVAVGTGITTGNIEFWPSNYNEGNSGGVPGASDTIFDCGDGGFNTTAGHGSMQVHNYGLSQTILSLVSFGSNGRTPGLGIGNNPNWTAKKDPDWTHQANAAIYSTRNIYVLARYQDAPAAITETGAVEILVQPQSTTVRTGATASLSVYAPQAAAYQWLKNGVTIPGANSSLLVIPNARATDAANYRVVVTEVDGDVALSQSAAIRVNWIGNLIILR